MMDFRCTDPDCQHAAAGIPEPGDGSGYEAARLHKASSGHDMVFIVDGQVGHSLDRTFMAWARRKGIIGPPVAQLPESENPEGDDGDPDEDPDDDERGDYPDEDGDENEGGDIAGGAGGHQATARRGGRPISVAGAYVLAVNFPLSNRTLMAVDSHLSEFGDLYTDVDGNELTYGEKLSLFFGKLVVRDMAEHPERYPVSRFLKRDGLDDIANHYRVITARLNEIEVHRRNLAQRQAVLSEREAAVERREVELRMNADGR